MYVVHAYMSTRVNGMANANRIDREPANNSPNSLLSLVLICLSPLCIDPARNSVSRVGDHARRQAAAGDTPTPHTAATKSPHKSTVAGAGWGCLWVFSLLHAVLLRIRMRHTGRRRRLPTLPQSLSGAHLKTPSVSGRARRF
jgi:hypothetical protein